MNSDITSHYNKLMHACISCKTQLLIIIIIIIIIVVPWLQGNKQCRGLLILKMHIIIIIMKLILCQNSDTQCDLQTTM